tara:strand:- start:511 stop:1479 length:969 start_codon:yes stop_codon:yes gene_type:complete
MVISELTSKWENVNLFQSRKGYKALRISSSCKSELYIATGKDGYRCLLLFLPVNSELKIKGADRNKLSLSFLPQKNVLIISLKDPEFIDLFNDLILSLYSKIWSIEDTNESSQELIYSFYKWADFFEKSNEQRLSEEQIMGLFGELFVLKELLYDSTHLNVNSILNSWRGPFGSGHDFEFDNKNVEVKTKKESKSVVYISSEFQLEKEFDKGLELLILSIKIDLTNGESLFVLISKCIKLIQNNIGDLTILYKALKEIGLSVETAKEYNNSRFTVLTSKSYDCCMKGFPKLSKSNVPGEITSLRYKLRVNSLSSYLLNEKKY